MTDEEVRLKAIMIAMDILKDKDGSIYHNTEEVIGTADRVSKFILNTKEVK